MKGALSSTMLIVLAVIVLAFGLSMVQGSFNLADAFDITGAKERQAALTRGDDLEAASKCAYYRCFGDDKGGKGCNSEMAKSISWNDDKQKCSEFCKKEFQDKDGRICNDKARAHPVEFLPVGTATIQADDLKEFGCVTPTDSCSLGFFGKRISTKGDKEILYIDVNEINSLRAAGTEACVGHLDIPKDLAQTGATATVVTVGVLLTGVSAGAGIGVATIGGTTAYFAIEKVLEDKTITSVTLKSGAMYLWAQDDSGFEQFAHRFITLDFFGSTTDHVYLCGNPPPQCKGIPATCSGRQENKCTRDLGCKFIQTQSSSGQSIRICANDELKDAKSRPITDDRKGSPTEGLQRLGPKPCEWFFDKNSCEDQLGCGWTGESKCSKDSDCPIGLVCGADNICRLPSINSPEDLAKILKVPVDDNVRKLKSAIDAVGGLTKAFEKWGVGTIANLYANPSVAGLDSWKEFTLCKDGVLPGGCFSEKPQYCHKGTVLNYPEKCGCPEGKATKLNEGGLGKQCENFDVDATGKPIPESASLVTGISRAVKADGKDAQIILATIFDSKNLVITGIDKSEVTFALDSTSKNYDEFKNEVTFGDKVCLSSGRINEKYSSCSVPVSSKKAGNVRIKFTHKTITETIEIIFVK